VHAQRFESSLNDDGLQQIDGACCSENRIIRNVLRDEWKYDGAVMSDWYGSHSGAESLAAGLDLEMPGPSVHRGAKLMQAIRASLVSHEDLDRSV
jgi:beta-glucosidase